MQLYNKLSAKERAELIEKAGKDRLTLSFYQYAKISNPQEFRDQLFMAWEALDVLGRIYVATEGMPLLKMKTLFWWICVTITKVKLGILKMR